MMNLQKQEQQPRSTCPVPIPDDTTIHEMALLWKSVLGSFGKQTDNLKSPPSRVYINAILPSGQTEPSLYDRWREDDISLVTHGSVEKLQRIRQQLSQWGTEKGPSSIALYISRTEEIDDFVSFYNSHKHTTFRQSTFHVLLEKPNALGYPHNRLRNLALQNCGTGFFLTLDGDFVTPYNGYAMIRSSLLQKEDIRRTIRTNTLVVLPAFEWFLPSGATNSSFSQKPFSRLRTSLYDKESLLKLWESGQVGPFHVKNAPKGHGQTNYEKWKKEDASSSDPIYSIEYAPWFEPYVIGVTQSVPRYWEELRGYGFNKLSWIMECHYKGFKFAVSKEMFAVHLNHEVPTNKHSELANEGFGHFSEYLVDAYGVAWNKLKRGIGPKLTHTDLYRDHLRRDKLPDVRNA